MTRTFRWGCTAFILGTALLGHKTIGAQQPAYDLLIRNGRIVAPGFIDLHTHSDLTLLNDGNAESKVRQGVTLDVIGESTSVAPRDNLPESGSTWTDFTGYWKARTQKGISINVISEVRRDLRDVPHDV